MAERDHPYPQFNFQVDMGNGSTAGFQEVSGLGMEITATEYRAGNWPENAAQKVPTLYKATDVTLKRGVIDAEELWEWTRLVRIGDHGAARRTVTITLQSENRTDVVSWILKQAFPTKYTAPTLNGNGTDLAVEELVLVCEVITQEVAGSS